MADDSPTTPKASQQTQGGAEFRLNVQNEPSSSSSQPEEVLEATAAPGPRRFARPGRRGASAGGSSRGSSGERRAGSTSPLLGATTGSGTINPMSPLLSPGVGPQRTSRAPSHATGSRGSSPLTLSSRSQSMLRAPHPFDEEDVAAVSEGAEAALVDPEVYARMFTEMQERHDSECKALEERVILLEGEAKKARESEEAKERYIVWADEHAADRERQVEQLGRENRLLSERVRATERQVRDLEMDIKRKEEESRVFIRDREGEEPISPGTANERFRRLREELKELKEERYRQNEELEVLFEKKEKYEELQEVHQALKEEYKSLEKELEVVQQARATPKVEQQPVVEMALKRASTLSMASTGVGGSLEEEEESSSPSPGIRRTETELQDIATLGHLVGEKDEQIMRLSQRLQDKDGHIAKLESSIADKEEQITRLKVESRKAHDRITEANEELAHNKEQYERAVERSRQEYSQLQQKLDDRETALAQEKERHESVESRLESEKRNLLARFKELEEGDKDEVEGLEKEVQEKEAEIAKLKRDKQELEQKRKELLVQNRQLQETARNVRKWQWDQPILQTIANTQLWSEKNIMKDALEGIKKRVKRVEPEQLEQAARLLGKAKQSLEALPGDVDNDEAREARQALAQQLDAVQQVLETRIQPLKAIAQEVSLTRDRLLKEKEVWAKEDAEITAVLRRIEGRGGHTGRRQSEHLTPKTDFMKRIEKLEDEQHAYITAKYDEYASIKAERPPGAPLTAQEDKRLHAMIREFVQRLPDNPMVAFLGGETPQARRKSQLFALTEKVKRLKIRDKGQDLQSWLPRLKPSTLEYKRNHALLVKELHGLEEQVEDVVQEINDLAAPPDLEEEYRGRPPYSRDDAASSSASAPAQQAQKPAVAPQQNPEKMRKREQELRMREDALRREIRFAHARLERLLYNRQLFEHWTENLEKWLNSEAVALVTQVLLEFELQTILDKESKEACFCSLLEYFFPRVYGFTVRGEQTLRPGRHGHGREHGSKRLGAVVEEEAKTPHTSGLLPPKTAGALLGRSETMDLSGTSRRMGIRRTWSRKGRLLTSTSSTTTTPKAGDGDGSDGEGEEIKRSRAPEPLRARFSQDDPAAPGPGQLAHPSTIYGGGGGVPSTAYPFIGGESSGKAKRRSVTFENPDKEEAGRRDIRQQQGHLHGHGGGHLSISPTAQFLREHAYPIFCQIMTSLIWFVLLLAIQPVNMFRTFSFLLSLAVGVPFYMVQASRFLLVKESSTSSLEKAKRADDKGEPQAVVKDQWQSPPPGGLDAFGGTSHEGLHGLGLMLPAETPHVIAGDVEESSSSSAVAGEPGRPPSPTLRGGGRRRPRWSLKKGLQVPEDYESESGSDHPPLEDEERLRTPSPATQGESLFLTRSDTGKAEKYVVSDDKDEEEPGYGSKRQPTELHELQAVATTPAGTSPPRTKPTESGSSKGKEKEEVSQPPGCGSGTAGGSGPSPQQPEEPGQQSSRARGPEQEPSASGQTGEHERSRNRNSPSPHNGLSEWDRERMLANAEPRMREEEQAKITRRRRWWWWWWWWRVWYWVLDVLVSVREFISSRWPSSWRHWRAARRTKPAPKGDVPDMTVTTATPIQPRHKDNRGLPEKEKKKDTKPPFWERWLALPRSFFDRFVVQKIPLLSVTARSFFQSGLTKLKSFLTRLLRLPRQLFSAILSRLDSLFNQLLNLSKRLFSSVLPFRTSLQQQQTQQQGANPPSRRAFQSLRSKVKVPAGIHIPRPNLNLHVPKLPSVSRLPKMNLKLPTITPPRPPSPPTILGTLLSLLVIYTLLTYLAVVKERAVWTSADTAWRHAYLRDLELSRVPVAAQAAVSQKFRNPLASLFGGPSRSSSQVNYINSAYPGWSPAEVDYRLVYAPFWWQFAYAPSDFGSWAGRQAKSTREWAGDTAQQVWKSTTQTLSDLKSGTPASLKETGGLVEKTWDEVKGISVSRIVHRDRIGAVEVPSKISLLGGWITGIAKGSWGTVRGWQRYSKDLWEEVFVDRVILVKGKGAVEAPSLVTLWRRRIGFAVGERWDSVGRVVVSWYSFFMPPVWCVGEVVGSWRDWMVELAERIWDRLVTWGSKIPSAGLLRSVYLSVSFWVTWPRGRAGEMVSRTWEAVTQPVLWGVNWVSDAAWKSMILGGIVVRRYILSCGPWFEEVWREVLGYGVWLGEMVGLR